MSRPPRRGARGGRKSDMRGGARRQRSHQGNTPRGQHGGRPSRPSSSDRSLGGEQVEGRQAVRELLIAARRRVRELLVADESERNPVIGEILDLARSQRVPVREVSRKEIDEQARSEAPQGVIAFAEPLEETLLDEVLAGAANGDKLFLVAIDGVTDPGNLGAILRSCEGAGVDAVILPRHRAVHVTPSAAKAAAGAIEYLTMCVVPGLPTAIQQLRDANVWVVGLDDAADKPVFGLGDLASEHICLVLGAEGPGLSRLVRERCDVIVSIPMRGALSSLNVSAAAALATYEVVRARHQ
ncbi:MAG: 23S rRNA (guanosine(2251)-2'-O)-methyltransferase RlmB [Ilumatobacteraceae bacterium]|jgi:23S rRNA (guanosine2251-2'-O)-methyltransferase|nr:23S rRNA (guanosine(2251)-2'-O)-methyltransferase RlmB [Ilumatobacteraceae bacterium]